jgi:hypothetical protein
MNTTYRGLLGFAIIWLTVMLPQGLQADDGADDGPYFYRPTVQVSVTATGNGQLHYQWRATVGRISNVDAPITSWTLPSGPGLHYAYVLVSDHHGGYTQGCVG